MKPGTIIRLPDGREGTVVYHGLDGYGVRFGRIEVNVDAILSNSNGCVLVGVEGAEPPEDWPWFPEAMLRDAYPGVVLPCVGEEYEVLDA